jgi:tetratricopeptide (TPR) repeat protein
MADDREDTGATPSDSAAVNVALNASGASEEARAYLRSQKRLADLQAEDLLREDKLRHWSLRIRHISDVLKLGFELALAFIVIAVAVGLGTTIWSAAHADGLVIQSFNVPAPMTEKGLTGQVVANKLLDRLTVMQNGTDSSRAASSFANDWSNDIKVEIPDSGISLGEVVRFLHGWLGHEMHLSGELYETQIGIALTMRMDNEPGRTFEGKASDLNGIVARTAEAVYARAQPYRYSAYLQDQGRFAESFAAGHALAAAGPRDETAWANVGLALLASFKGDDAQARAYVESGREANPDLPNFDFVLGGLESSVGHDEAALDDTRHGNTLLKGEGAREWNPAAIPATLQSDESVEAQQLGDFAQALAKMAKSPGGGGDEFVAAQLPFDAVSMHDIAAARRYLAALEAMRGDPDPQNAALADAAQLQGLLAMETRDWSGAIAALDEAAVARHKIETATHGWISAKFFLRTGVLPFKAYGLAILGEFDKADAILKTLPEDCDICMRMRGKVEAARRNWAAAAHWFALVAARSPDIPFADTDWGQMLFAKGDTDGAIAKFQAAHKIGPHIADPLEMWGEALIAKNRSDLALAKFEEANRYAPNWGRLHLKWGEAFFWSGDKGGAQKQFAIAVTLDLSSDDKASLGKWTIAHG